MTSPGRNGTSEVFTVHSLRQFDGYLIRIVLDYPRHKILNPLSWRLGFHP
jgi:hypothetical protein